MSDSIFDRFADALEFNWPLHARPEQLMPPDSDPWVVWLYLAGRGAGKTRAGAEAVRSWIETGRCRRVGLIAPTAADARDVMLEGDSGILSVCPNSNRPTYEPSKRRLTWSSGQIATIYSAEEADRLRGPQHDGLWCDELAAWKDAENVWDMAMFGLRLGKNPRVIVTTTPRSNVKLLRDFLKREGQDVRVTRGRTIDNKKNLAASFLESIVNRYAGTRLGRQELDAEILDDVQGALWSRDLLDRTRRQACPPLTRIVVAIDPATSFGEDSDETGIIVAGVGEDGHCYIITDASGRMEPTKFAQKAVELYRFHAADRVVAEVNNGGALVEATLRAVDKNIPYRAVHATRAKIVRAEPIAALFEQGRAHIVGTLPKLEDQMCTFAAGSSASPDRLDAMVWALTDLVLAAQRPQLIWSSIGDQDHELEVARRAYSTDHYH